MKITQKKSWQRETKHLREVANEHGYSDSAEWVNQLVLAGLQADQARQQAERKEAGKEKKTNPYISDAGKCLRKVGYSLLGDTPAEEFTADSLMNFMVGHAVEEAVAKVLEAQGARVRREVRVEIPVGSTVVSGRLDFIVELPDAHTVIELKSTSSRAMGMMLKAGEQGRAEHRAQLMLYIHAARIGLLGDELKGMDFAYLTYVVKDGIKGEPITHAFRVDYNGEEAVNMLTALALTKGLADKGELPPIPTGYTRSFWACRYCPYQAKCWSA